MDGFGVDDKVDERKEPIILFDTVTATCLRDGLAKSKRLMRPPNLHQWAEHVRRMRILDKVDADRIRDTMVWYTQHLGESRVPDARSTENFRKKFPMIEKAMAIAADRPPDLAGVRPDVLLLIKRMGLHWPENTNPDEAAPCLQKSIDDYNDLRRRLTRAKANPPAHLRGFRKAAWPHLMEELLNRTRGNVMEIGEAWLREVHTIAWRWEAWGGHLAKWAWRPTTRRWAKLAAGWVMEHSGRAFTWEEIIRELYNGPSGNFE